MHFFFFFPASRINSTSDSAAEKEIKQNQTKSFAVTEIPTKRETKIESDCTKKSFLLTIAERSDPWKATRDYRASDS